MRQTVQLFWFSLIFFVPMWAVVYVGFYDLRNGDVEAFHHVCLMLSLSLFVALVCAVAQPIRDIDAVSLARLGMANLFFAVFDTGAFALLVYYQSAPENSCRLTADCDKYPLIWLALGGMHFCYAVWAYATKLKTSR